MNGDTKKKKKSSLRQGSSGLKGIHKQAGGHFKSEFSPSLASIDSKAPEVEQQTTTQNMWDSEAEHMLSYFLGDSQQNAKSEALSFTSARHGHSRDPSLTSSSTTDDDDPPLPPTPAVHYYTSIAPADEGVASAPSRSSDSSSSLASIAAALVSGGPLVQKLRESHQSYSGNSPAEEPNISPISPVAMIGSGTEHLMLPPPSRSPAQQNYPQAQNTAGWEQQHMAWLRDLNAMAKNSGIGQSRPGANPTTVVLPVPVPQPPTAGVYPSYIAPNPHFTPVYPSATSTPTTTPAMLAPAAPPSNSHASNSSRPESEAKRKKRLERNRESARKSRQRKKDKLSSLEAQVNAMYEKIVVERSRQIKLMNRGYRDYRRAELMKCCASSSPSYPPDFMDDNSSDFASAAVEMDIAPIMRESGPVGRLATSAREFQYASLKSTILPRHQKLLLWFTTVDKSDFFTSGKQEYALRNKGKMNKSVSGKISSKQVGEDMLSLGPGDTAPEPNRDGDQDGKDDENGAQFTATTDDHVRFWPLFCCENSFSFEQEERFIAAQRQALGVQNLPPLRAQLQAGLVTTQRLKEAVDSLSQACASREEHSFIRIMRPSQTAEFHKWTRNNSARIRMQKKVQETQERNTFEAAASQPEGSLLHICERLREVLQISKAPE